MKLLLAALSCAPFAMLFAETVTGQVREPAHRPANRPPSQPTARALPKDAHGIVMDALAKSTLDRWEKLEYHLGRAGVKKISFSVKIVAKGILGDQEATGSYSFDGKKGKLSWSDAALGDMLAQRGFSQENFDRLLVGDSHRRALAGATLTARSQDGATILDIKGDTPGGYKNFQFDQDGVATKSTMLVDHPTAGKVDAVLELEHAKVGKKHLQTGRSFAMDLPGGAVRGKVRIRHKLVGKFHVYGSVVETLTMGDRTLGTHTLTFSDYKINGTITEEPDPKKDTTTEKPASRPTVGPVGPPKSTANPKR